MLGAFCDGSGTPSSDTILVFRSNATNLGGSDHSDLSLQFLINRADLPTVAQFSATPRRGVPTGRGQGGAPEDGRLEKTWARSGRIPDTRSARS